MHRRLVLLLAVTTFILGTVAAQVITHLRAGKPLSAWQHTMFHLPGGTPRTVTIHLRDATGLSLEGVDVSIEDQSATPHAITDSAGQAVITAASSAILHVAVNRRLIASSNILCHLDCTHGLEIFYQSN